MVRRRLLSACVCSVKALWAAACEGTQQAGLRRRKLRPAALRALFMQVRCRTGGGAFGPPHCARFSCGSAAEQGRFRPAALRALFVQARCRIGGAPSARRAAPSLLPCKPAAERRGLRRASASCSPPPGGGCGSLPRTIAPPLQTRSRAEGLATSIREKQPSARGRLRAAALRALFMRVRCRTGGAFGPLPRFSTVLHAAAVLFAAFFPIYFPVSK